MGGGGCYCNSAEIYYKNSIENILSLNLKYIWNESSTPRVNTYYTTTLLPISISL